MRKKIPLWESAPFDIADAQALKAMNEGVAEPHQQQRAIQWITKVAARLNRLSFDPESERATAFAEGRRFVGMQIRRLIETPNDELRKELNQQ